MEDAIKDPGGKTKNETYAWNYDYAGIAIFKYKRFCCFNLSRNSVKFVNIGSS